MSIQVKTDTMEIKDERVNVSYLMTGYVSHSFNQFVIADDDHMITVDHGDSHPRSAVLNKYTNNISGGYFSENLTVPVELISFYGEKGNNYTNASIGGLAASSTHYLVVGNSTPQDENANKTRNIFVSTAEKEGLTSDLYWLTNTEELGYNDKTTPQLVPLGDDRFLVMWSAYNQNGTVTKYSYNNLSDISWQILDHEGKPVTDIYKGKGLLSDCQPVVKDGKVIWYVQEDQFITLYDIDLASMSLDATYVKHPDHVPVERIEVEPDTLEIALNQTAELEVKAVPENASDTRTMFTSGDPDIADVTRATINPVSLGETVIRGKTLTDGAEDSTHVKVIPAVEFTSKIPKLNINKTEEVQWNLSISPESMKDYLKVESSDPSVVSVTKDGYKGVSEGKARVTLSIGVKTYSYDITVVYTPVTGIYMNPSIMSLKIGETGKITAYATPVNASISGINWSSSDPSVAEVDQEGNIKAISYGHAVITAVTQEGEFSKSCNVGVRIPVDGIEISESNISLARGETYTLSARVLPEDTVYSEVVWSSDNKEVADVIDGAVTAKGAGKATITASTIDGSRKAECKVQVHVDAEQLLIDRDDISIGRGEWVRLEASILPEDVTLNDASWTADDPEIVGVYDIANGVGCSMEGLKSGTTIVRGVTKDGKKTAECRVTVYTPLKYLSLDSRNLSMAIGKTHQLNARFSPEDADDLTVTWTSDHPEIASVDQNGNVTAHSEGAATVTVSSTAYGLSAACSVSVFKSDQPTALSLSFSAANLYPSESITNYATPLPYDNGQLKIIWTSSDPQIASVDQGKITAVKEGTAVITAKIDGTDISAECMIHVIPEGQVMYFEEAEYEVQAGSKINVRPSWHTGSKTQKLIFTADDESVVNVQTSTSGMYVTITGKAVGNTYINAVSEDGQLHAKCSVKVIIKPIHVIIDSEKSTMFVGDSFEFKAHVIPENATNQKIIWRSYDENVVTVDENTGLVTAVGEGETSVFAAAEENGVGTSRHITVKKRIGVTGIAIGYKELVLRENVSYIIRAAVEPQDASNKNIIWTTSDPAVAEVDQTGTVRTHNAGTAIITVTSEDGGYTDQCILTVFRDAQENKPESIELNTESFELSTGFGYELKAYIYPEDADQDVFWTSGNPSVAEVDSNGRVTALRYGTVLITAASQADPSLIASCTVQTRYYDVDDRSLYYFNPVYWAADRNITKGYDNVYFGPKNNCTREAVVTFLWRLAGKPDPENMNSPFSDIQNPDKYYYKAVLWAAEQGITKGYDDGTFKPNATCLREHVVTFLWRYAEKPEPVTSKNPFNDVSKSDYYYKACLWAQENGIAKGYSSGEHKGGFGPKLDCLREHVVTFLYRSEN